ncbi:MAG: peptidase M29 [Gammaproteobacteria bacterium]|nr:peptidase M29 [Gammaproteobacteria bacterium]
MLNDRIEKPWLDAFQNTFSLCGLQPGDSVAILSESQSREINLQLAELALLNLGTKPFHVRIPTPAGTAPVPVRSTGASKVLTGLQPVIDALGHTTMVIDCTVEGLLHAPELPTLLAAGTRILMVSNEHPETLARLQPDVQLTPKVKAAAKLCKQASQMRVTSTAGTNLTVDMSDAPTAGVWGYTERPGTLAHWPAGVVVSFPKQGSTNGTLVLAPGDINLTFKRYLQDAVTLTIENDYVTRIEGRGTDAELMRRYWAAWGDQEAYAVSHVGFGMNPKARYEALTMYDQRDTNGTELRAFAGNFLFSTGANEFADRYTEGHFDLPVCHCDIWLDDLLIIKQGQLQGELA